MSLKFEKNPTTLSAQEKSPFVEHGYQETDLGVIPKDWEVVNVGKVTVDHKQGYYTKDLYVDNGVRLVRITDLQNPRIDFDSMPKLRVSELNYKQYQIRIGDFLFARSGAIGRYGIVCKEVKAIFGSYIIRFNFDEHRVRNDYFGYVFQNEDTQKQLLAITQGSSNININAGNIKSLKIPLPSVAEQTAIANALSDVDALIQELEKLIAKKQAIKTATMQQLLTGRTRLPHFALHPDGRQKGYKPSELGEIPEDWEVLPSSSAIEFFGGYGFSSRLSSSSGIKWLKIANVGLNEIKWESDSYLPESLLADFKDFQLSKNDVVMALTRPILNEKLKIAKLQPSDLPSLLNQRVAKLVAKKDNDLNYIYHIVQRADFIAQMNLAMAGTDPPNIGTQALGKIRILVPQPSEQTAIAIILSDMDKDIQSLEQRLNKTRQIKQGMMQELLTGKTRLVQPLNKESQHG